MDIRWTQRRPFGRLCSLGGHSGFTIVELILVIVILGILAAVAGPRFVDHTAFEARGYYDEMVSALRYAQKTAVGSGCPVRVQITPAGYQLNQQVPAGNHCNAGDTSWAITVRLPDGEAVVGSTPAGVTVAPALTVVFTALGDTNLGADAVITVGTRSLTVQAATGYVVTP